VARTPVRRLIEKGIEAGADYIPDVIEGPLRKAFSIDVPKSKASKPKTSLAVTPKPKAELAVNPKPKALPAPPKQLALPAPGPGLPPFAVKTKGGQWMVDKPFMGVNLSAENAARGILARAQRPQDEGKAALYDWWHKALPRYMKNEMATPEDPLRDLAARGLLHVDKTPDEWSALAGSVVNKPSLQNLLYGESSAAKDELLSEMPWLAKVPATDNLYGITPFNYRDLEFGHVADELETALRADQNGLPPELMLRPESLQRMSFPAAVERVGRINQFRVKEMERAALNNLDSPAVQTFKEYTENNPLGLRWAELKSPSEESGLFKIVPAEDQGVPFHYVEDTATGERTPIGGTREDALRQAQEMYGRDALQQALDYEGNTMGHCVGGYCPDVMEGRSRIFSLRDAKGEPHVTIETSPTRYDRYDDLPEEDQEVVYDMAFDRLLQLDQPHLWEDEGLSLEGMDALQRHRDLITRREYIPTTPAPDQIIQIKGKQNRAPKDDYLPFVQDFVKSQPWSNVGDFKNTGLVKLPDGRYITDAQYHEGALKASKEIDYLFDPYTNRYRVPDEDWDAMRPYFEGYAIGGRVCADRCFSKGKSAVYAVNKSRK
jgi:hypothetical protein